MKTPNILIAICLVCAALTGCAPGFHGIAVHNASDQPMTLEIVRVGTHRVDRSLAIVPPASQHASIVEGKDRLLFAETRVRAGDSQPGDPWFVFSVPTAGMFYYEANISDGRVLLTETGRFDVVAEQCVVTPR